MIAVFVTENKMFFHGENSPKRGAVFASIPFSRGWKFDPRLFESLDFRIGPGRSWRKSCTPKIPPEQCVERFKQGRRCVESTDVPSFRDGMVASGTFAYDLFE